MHAEQVTYQADGITLHSRLFVPPTGGPHPGVLVFPEAFQLRPACWTAPSGWLAWAMSLSPAICMATAN